MSEEEARDTFRRIRWFKTGDSFGNKNRFLSASANAWLTARGHDAGEATNKRAAQRFFRAAQGKDQN